MSPWLPWAFACLGLGLAATLCLRATLRERRLRQLLDGTPHPMYLLDGKGQLLDCNQRYRHDPGIARQQVIEAQHAQALCSGKAVIGDCAVHSGGQALTLHHWARPVRDGAGRVTGLACGWVDVSERSEQQAQLQRANLAKTRFLAMLGHEVRNPLNALNGLLELAARDPAAVDATSLRYAHSAGLAVLALIDDAVDIACIEAGQLRLEPRPVVLSEWVQATCGLFSQDAQQKGLCLSLRIAPAARGCFIVDPDRLRQVLSNLLCNAIKYTERGQVQVRLKSLGAAPGQIAKLWLSISDTGPGIDPADQQRAFAPFTRVGKAAQRSPGSLGLGLAICKELAPLLGARLLLRSRPGHGTCLALRLCLPATQQPPSALASTPPAPGGKRRAERGNALIIEDHPANRLLLTRQLTELGFTPTAVTSALAALRACRRERYPLIITDCSLPGHDGYTLARALRRQERRLQRRPSMVIGYTAHSGPEVRRHCLDAGMDECLHKPVDLATLRHCLAAVAPTTGRIDLAGLDQDGALQAAIRTACAEDRLRLASDLPRHALLDLAHRVKGMAMMIDAYPLAAAASALEQAAAAGERLEPARQALAEALFEEERRCAEIGEPGPLTSTAT